MKEIHIEKQKHLGETYKEPSAHPGGQYTRTTGKHNSTKMDTKILKNPYD